MRLASYSLRVTTRFTLTAKQVPQAGLGEVVRQQEVAAASERGGGAADAADAADSVSHSPLVADGGSTCGNIMNRRHRSMRCRCVLMPSVLPVPQCVCVFFCLFLTKEYIHAIPHGQRWLHGAYLQIN